MNFYFKKLSIKDWLVYGGKTILEFSPIEENKNIIVINGKNGYGKTSLLRSLEFLFNNNYNRQGLIEKWNDKARNEKDGNLEVALEFEYQGQLFNLIRKVDFSKKGKALAVSESVQLLNETKGEPENQVDDKLELMIPKKSQQFVFFDGAEITRYAQKQHDEGVRGAIEQVLGIPAVKNLKQDLEKVLRDLKERQADILTQKGISEELLSNQDQLENEKRQYEEQIELLSEKLDSVKKAYAELEIESAQILAIKSEQELLTNKRERLADYTESFESVNQQIKDFVVNDAAIMMLLGPITQIIQENTSILQQGTNDRKTYIEKVLKYIDRLLDDGNWEFGDSVPEEVEPFLEKELIFLKSKLTNIPSSSREGLSISDLTILKAKVESLKKTSSIKTLLDRRSISQVKIEEIEKDISDLKKKLEGHSNLDVQEIFSQLKAFGEQEMALKMEIDSFKDNLFRVGKELEQNQRELNKATSGTEEGPTLSKKLSISQKLLKAVTSYVDRLVEKKRSDIEELTSSIFSSITNKPIEYAGVKVNDDYTLEVYRKDGSKVENKQLSAGEKEVLAFSFITSLNLSSPNPAPFLMDTPFGHLDSSHRDGLLKSLPNLPVQIFLLATDRDLPDEEKEKMRENILQEFVIKRDQRTSKSLIEEE